MVRAPVLLFLFGLVLRRRRAGNVFHESKVNLAANHVDRGHFDFNYVAEMKRASRAITYQRELGFVKLAALT